MTWAAIAEVCLVGVGVVWLVTTAGTHAGYGRIGSIAVVALSVVLTAVAALSPSGMRRGPRLFIAGFLAVVAGGVVPLAITDLFTGLGVGIPLALAVAGMEVLAVHLIRARTTP
jgi:hypothetical protein